LRVYHWKAHFFRCFFNQQIFLTINNENHKKKYRKEIKETSTAAAEAAATTSKEKSSQENTKREQIYLQMFNVGRFDPRKEAQESSRKTKRNQQQHNNNNKKKKRPRENTSEHDDLNDSNNKKESSLYVIAPEAKGPVSVQRKSGRIEEEAFDDMELVEDYQPMKKQTESNRDAVAKEFDDNTEKDKESQSPALLPVKSKHIRSNEKSPSTTTIPTAAAVPDEIRKALYMSSLPIRQAAKQWNLAPFIVDNLEKEGFDHFFPIQALVIPDIIASERHSYIRAQDVCVSAATGSGKTLAFVLPILNALAKRNIPRLRALVVLPSRDLAQQVHDVFQSFAKGSDLKIGLAIGQSDFKQEQIALTVGPTDKPPRFGTASLDAIQQRRLFEPGNAELLMDSFASSFHSTGHSSFDSHDTPAGGRSAVDVLVCTPGRLVDHLDNTPGFTLQHLRFLVVDEADRLLSQTYHNWIKRVIDSANGASVAAWHDIRKMNSGSDNHDYSNAVPPFREAPDGCSYDLDMITWRRGGTAGDESSFNTNESSVVATVCRPLQLRKLLYSATLTRDPQKLATLRLVNPKHFDARKVREAGLQDTVYSPDSNNKYSMPHQLLEYFVECTAEQKPIVLLALRLERLKVSSDAPSQAKTKKKSVVAVFTSNLESTHRLARLLQLLWKCANYGSANAIAEFSSSLNQKERSHLVKRCSDVNDDISVVVCSDGMSRGMDIEQVGTVINYDVPGFAKTYVHRCGRTARAGKVGSAISLLKGGQQHQFHKMRNLIDDPERVQSMAVKKNLVKSVVAVYKPCLKALADVIAAEQSSDLRQTDDIPPDMFPTNK